VLPAGKFFEHRDGVGFVLRLAENFAVEDDDGVRPDDAVVRVGFRHIPGFDAGGLRRRLTGRQGRVEALLGLGHRRFEFHPGRC